ncbi:MAG TPA: type II toxin-antitoxin system MqsR family toxin [Gallionellaceae bacterium]|nr:type II toxin-antitoxin system MqsR family toxin [Gallionellaceae bacterium]
MEKRSPHYSLSEIHAQMTSAMSMNLTESARCGIHEAGMGWEDALAVVRGLRRKDFYKSMTTHHDHRIWQDVYHASWREKVLYVKFQKAGEFFVISFKEL